MQLILETSRLTLRPLALDDVALGLEMFTDPAVMKYVGELETEESVQSGMSVWTQRCAKGGIGVWVATDKASGEQIGTGILLPLPIELDDTDWSLVQGDAVPDVEIEVGYILKPAAWGKGYATEIAQRLLGFGFQELGLAEIVAVTDEENAPSRHVLEKCGLVDHGMRRAYAGEVTNYRISREAWEARS